MMVNSVVFWPPGCVADDAKAPPTLSCSTELREKEVGKCPCGRLYGLSADEERIHFHRAEIPLRQHPHELPGLELCPRAVFTRRDDPQPGDGACRGSFVDGDSELAVNAHGGDAPVLAEGESLDFPLWSGGFCNDPEHPRRAEWQRDGPGGSFQRSTRPERFSACLRAAGRSRGSRQSLTGVLAKRAQRARSISRPVQLTRWRLVKPSRRKHSASSGR